MSTAILLNRTPEKKKTFIFHEFVLRYHCGFITFLCRCLSHKNEGKRDMNKIQKESSKARKSPEKARQKRIIKYIKPGTKIREANR